jgi:carbonic anhydrase
MPTPAIPEDGLKGLLQNWRNDLIAGFSAALVSLPLGLGIAIAAGAPIMSGVFAAILGGLLTTFLRHSKISINGPGNAMIVVIASALATLGDFRVVLAAIACSGFLMVLMGLFRFGRLTEALPHGVIQGLLTAIGIIIMVKQLYISLGTQPSSSHIVDMIKELPLALARINPFVALISLVSMLILILHPKVKNKLIHFVPAPLWVIICTIPMVQGLNVLNGHTVTLFNRSYHMGSEFLMQLPTDISQSILFPDFSAIGSPAFWGVVLTLALVNTIETVVSITAVDKLDPFRRKTNTNQDLMAIGATTILGGSLGALPVSTVIVRSSVNVNHGAKTRWSNFYQGLILLACILFLAPVMRHIPLAALAALLVFSGFKLTAPKVYKDAYQRGPEQLLIVVLTIVSTLYTDLLRGIVIGMAAELLLHMLLVRMPIKVFIRSLLKPGIQKFQETNPHYLLKMGGIANFATLLPLKSELELLPEKSVVNIDLSDTNIVDLTVMEYLEEFAEKYIKKGGDCHILGLDLHQSSSDHPHAMRLHLPPNKIYSLTRRQRELGALAETQGWTFEPQIFWGTTRTLRRFKFFDSRPIAYRNNILLGAYPELDMHWEIFDITFQEGTLIGAETYRTTVQMVRIKKQLPVFTLEREEILDRMLSLTGYEEAGFKVFTDFSKKFVLKSLDETHVRNFFTPKMIAFFESEDIYHLESSGEALFIFKYLRLASPRNIEDMVNYSQRLLIKLQGFTRSLN